MMGALYEKDFFAWTLEQVELLKSKRLDEVDIEHLIEEIETMGVVKNVNRIAE